MLAGITFARITTTGTPAAANQPPPEVIRRFTNFTLGVGGNLDLLGAAFK